MVEVGARVVPLSGMDLATLLALGHSLLPGHLDKTCISERWRAPILVQHLLSDCRQLRLRLGVGLPTGSEHVLR